MFYTYLPYMLIRTMIIRAIYIATILFLISSCKKDELIKYSNTPEIEFVSMSPSSTVEFEDQIIVKIKYKDGDGDIGTDDPDDYSIQIKDARLPAPDWYHVPPLTPPGQTLQIEGELEIVLTGLFVLGNNNQESTSFTIKLKDRAGNWSNEVKTSTLTILKAQ